MSKGTKGMGLKELEKITVPRKPSDYFRCIGNSLIQRIHSIDLMTL